MEYSTATRSEYSNIPSGWCVVVPADCLVGFGLEYTGRTTRGRATFFDTLVVDVLVLKDTLRVLFGIGGNADVFRARGRSTLKEGGIVSVEVRGCRRGAHNVGLHVQFLHHGQDKQAETCSTADD